jgi:hypothetical protein
MSDEHDVDPSLPQHRQGLIFVLLVLAAFVVVFGIFYYQQWSAQQEFLDDVYNGFEFTKQGDDTLTLWTTLIETRGQAFRIPFYYHPRELEDIGMQEGITRRFLANENFADVIYLTFQPGSSNEVIIAGVEISRITGFKYDLINIETHPALQWQPEGDSEYPVVTCADATAEMAVLSFEPGEYNEIFEDGENPHCLRFTYKNESDSIRVADRFVYGLLGIMSG